MWTYEEIDKYLRCHLTEERVKHSLGVVETSEKLAELYGVSKEKAKLAALIHDCAKNMRIDRQFSVLRDNGIFIDEVSENSPQVLHGKVGALIAKNLMGIEDEEILSAVEFHTTGKKDMSILEKIIYIADYIEPNREYPGVKELREITFRNLDEGVIKGFDNTITHVIKLGQLIHPLTIEARNDLLLKNK